MGFFHPALIHDPGQAERSRPAEVRRVEVAPHEVPAWKGLRLAQSSAGPSFGIGSSAGPVGGSINPYTAVPGSAASEIGATSADTRGFGGDSSASGFNGTQQEQGGGAGVGSSGAASPSSSGASPARSAVPTSGEAANHGAPGASDRGALGGNRGARLMDTGESVKTPPPASLTDKPATGSAAAHAKKPRKAPAPRPPANARGQEPGADSTPPPPPPVDTGIGSTR
jgi:hypothetical protein